MTDYGERITGTRDEHYNLVSVLYHAMQGAHNCERYALDAEASADERLAAFFREAQRSQVRIAERGKKLLGIVEPAPEFDAAPESSERQGRSVFSPGAGPHIAPDGDR